MSHSAAQWNAFIKEIIGNRIVFTIKDEGGIPTSTNIDGETSMPFWSLKSRAEKIIENIPSYSRFQVYEISLNDIINKWLKGLENDGLFVGVNWSGIKAKGYDINPAEVLDRIQYEHNLFD
ncbi:DUF2750 domain-containing protein [Bacillus sp. EAC]|uniref:DUF2750 domain-containing protein n=1 Tax=Bacillus sp. EAC TaxID=1978338 RepID=UPI000B4468BB|nr:DUF2750 domain-containing protein [Bacillus sp. EAC]